MLLIDLLGPPTVVIIVFAYVVRPSVLTFQYLAK